MAIRIHARDYDLVDFLYDHDVYNPADAIGKRGETHMLPEPLAKKLRDRGYGRLVSEIDPDAEPVVPEPKRFEDVPVVEVKKVDFVYTQPVTCPADVAGELNEIRTLPEPVAKELAGRGFGKIKELADDTGDKGTGESTDSRSNTGSGDAGKKGAVSNRKRRKSVDTPADGA
jgi:hypothetical protein